MVIAYTLDTARTINHTMAACDSMYYRKDCELTATG
jgi:hypothetical protein